MYTGNEIISAGKSLKSGLVYDPNGPMIFDLCMRTGNQPYLNKIVKDNPKVIRTTISRLLKSSDLIIFLVGLLKEKKIILDQLSKDLMVKSFYVFQ